MAPLAFPDKRAAQSAASLERFGIGFVIAVASPSWLGWVAGAFLGLLLSAPSAII